jgi:ParB family chromosome partitioning protein
MQQQNMKLVTVLTSICCFPQHQQPRTWTDSVRDYCRRLGENMLAHGQKVPVIGWFAGEFFQLADGGCRLEGAKLVGIPELLALDLGKEPTKGELLMAQASIDLHKQHLPPVDRARLYRSIMTERGFNGKQTAEALKTSESWLSRFLPLTDLAPDLQELVNSGGLEWTKGSLIAQAAKDFEQQRELAKAAAGMTRDALAASVRKARNGQVGKKAVRVARIRCQMPSGVLVTLAGQGDGLTLSDIIEELTALLKEAKKADEQGLDSKTFSAVLRDKAKAS